MLRNKRAQSTLEYIIVLTAIVGAVLLGARLIGGSSDEQGVRKLMNKAGGIIGGSSDNLVNGLSGLDVTTTPAVVTTPSDTNPEDALNDDVVLPDVVLPDLPDGVLPGGGHILTIDGLGKDKKQ